MRITLKFIDTLAKTPEHLISCEIVGKPDLVTELAEAVRTQIRNRNDKAGCVIIQEI